MTERETSMPNVGLDFGFHGRNAQASIRYSIGLHRNHSFVESLQFGYDFKTTKNNLTFGGTEVSKTNSEIHQFLTYAANLTDRMRSSSFDTSLVYSPAGITPNTSAAFQPTNGQSGIPGASAHYIYWRANFARLNKLPKKEACTRSG